MTVPSLFEPDGSLTHCTKEKATLFACVFDGKKINQKLAMAQSCSTVPKLTSLAFCSREIEKILLVDLDAYGRAVLILMVSSLWFSVKTSHYLPPKISTVLRKTCQSW